ncbi:amidase [Agromyces mangrovi Wang et al. 2018]|uniref:amidase n=1 Tax=Agromyces mangrovi TaxID=1858653 RepID=UPI0025734457|nr:amidase [Agromyces mangrovi]BDZ64088.1 amidase [Agromyces mangrovi]
MTVSDERPIGASDDLALRTATELVAGYAAHEFNPVDVLDAVLARVDRLEPRLNAFYRLVPEQARAAAAASARRWAADAPAGPLDGVPITIKENVATAGTPQPSGTAAWADAPPATADGPIARLLAESGAVRFGTTVMPDFGMLSSGVSGLHGITRSPWNPAWTVGGSSGGAGAAAAASLGPLHSGSDIGGSVRLPASWLGLVGHKPTHGLVPVDPPYPWRCIGPLARTVDDASLFLEVATGADARDHTQVPVSLDWDLVRNSPREDMRGLRIAWHLDAGWGATVDPEVAAVVRGAVDRFADAGADVTEIAPFATPEMLDGLDLFLRARSLLDLERMPPERRERVLPFILDWTEGARGAEGLAVLDAFQQVQALRARTVAATLPYDVVVSPVSPGAAFPAEWPMPSNDPATSLHHIGFTAPYNVSDQPAVSLNAGFTADGRPVGVQLAGQRFDDVVLLRVARWFEGARGSAATPDWASIG